MTKAFTEIGAKPLPQETNSCWSCGSMRAAHFCEACGKVQPPAPDDYLYLLGLTANQTIDDHTGQPIKRSLLAYDH